MGIGTSLFLIAAGAILRWAVTDTVSGIDLKVVGLVLLIVGILGLVISFIFVVMGNDRGRDGQPYSRGRDLP
jgi:hypothetical protein